MVLAPFQCINALKVKKTSLGFWDCFGMTNNASNEKLSTACEPGLKVWIRWIFFIFYGTSFCIFLDILLHNLGIKSCQCGLWECCTCVGHCPRQCHLKSKYGKGQVNLDLKTSKFG